MQSPEPQKEHLWLHQLIGDWTYVSECSTGPDQPPMQMEGTESVRTLGGLWTIGEAVSKDPADTEFRSIMTLGFDPATNRFVGTFIASVMTHLWPYSGSLDPAEKILTLDSDGPSFSGDGTVTKYQDMIEILSNDHRTLSSQCLGPDGNWIKFMTGHYYRVLK
jgi:Protein of unknown function (DUF1579)